MMQIAGRCIINHIQGIIKDHGRKPAIPAVTVTVSEPIADFFVWAVLAAVLQLEKKKCSWILEFGWALL
jgi:hypothetical protein